MKKYLALLCGEPPAANRKKVQINGGNKGTPYKQSLLEWTYPPAGAPKGQNQSAAEAES